MTLSKKTTRHQPRLVGIRKPLRPVHVAAVRTPVSVTKPVVLGGEFVAQTPYRPTTP